MIHTINQATKNNEGYHVTHAKQNTNKKKITVTTKCLKK